MLKRWNSRIVLNLSCICLLLTCLPNTCISLASDTSDPLSQPDLSPVKMLSTPEHPAISLVTDGRADAVIYVAPALAEQQRDRAFKVLLGELLEVIELSTGAKLTVIKERPGPEQPAIIVGDCAASREAGIRAEELPFEGFVVKTAPNRVFLVGSTRELPYAKAMLHHQTRWPTPIANEGDAWALADFLERFVGVRWYWPAEALGRSIVNAKSLTVPAVHYCDAPAFRLRDFGLWGALRKIPSQEFRVRRWFDHDSPSLPVPEGVEGLTPPYTQLREGTSWPYQISVHSLPVSRERMLCSQELIDYIVKAAEQYWDHNNTTYPDLIGGEGRPFVTPDAVHVSYVDRGVTLDHVKGEYQELVKGGTWNRSSHVMGLTVKMLATEVKRRWPDKKVVYLPYWDYVTPPDIDFPDNVEIQLCLTHTDGMAGMAEPGKRALNVGNIRKWSEKTGRKIGLWDYAGVAHFDTFAPVQHPHLIQKIYQDNKDQLAGTFVDTTSVAFWSKGAPTAYVWMRLLWNPDANVDAILDEWCRRMFGPAANTSRELLSLMCERWENSRWSQPKGQSVGLGAGGVVFCDKWPPNVVRRMNELRNRMMSELREDANARQRLQYWVGDELWKAFLDEAEITWEATGLTPKRPQIKTFEFHELEPPVVGKVISNVGGVEPEGNVLYPFGCEIQTTVPAATNLQNLQPTIRHNGARLQPTSGTPQDFTKAVRYTVTGQDGAITIYRVQVTHQKD